MSETVVTIEIGKAIQSGLSTYIPAPKYTVTLVGVDKAAIHLPAVGVRVGECVPNGFKSALRSYPVTIQAATNWHDDKDAAVLHLMAQAVSLWLMSAPALSLTLAHHDALYCPTAPEMRDVTLDNGQIVQMVEWQVECKVGKVTATLAAID